MISSYKEAISYLDSFINYEKKIPPYPRVWKLERVEALLRILNINYQNLKVIHIAGTKGKGSTAIFLSYVLASLGYKTGVFVSPHLDSYRERISTVYISPSKKRVVYKNIPASRFTSIMNCFFPALEKWSQARWGKITFFEILTALSMKYFLDKNMDFVILECGLGGRLDATNVIERPLLSIITHIGYDHTHILGNSLKKIAQEKSGIIKKDSLVITARQKPSVLSVIEKNCKEKKVPFYILGKDFFCEKIRLRKSHTLFDLRTKDMLIKNLKIVLKGEHQVENASLAVVSSLLLVKDREKFSISKIKQGLKNASVPGRFEAKGNLILDIAHNLSSLLALKKSLNVYFPRYKIITVFALSKDKDAAKILGVVDSFSHKVIFTTTSNPRSQDPQYLRRILGRGEVEPDIKKALKKAFGMHEDNCKILITGSTFLVSQARKIIRGCLRTP